MVVVDDGSTDRSQEIMSRFPVRVVPTLGTGRAGGGAQPRRPGGDGRVSSSSSTPTSWSGPTRWALLAEAFERRRGRRLLRGAGRRDAAPRPRQPVQKPVDALDLLEADWRRAAVLHHRRRHPAGRVPARRAASTSGYATPNVEDTAFGQKLARLGVRVRIHPQLEVEHVKRYSLRGLLRTDFMRAVSLTRLKLRHPDDLGENNTSVPVELHGERAAQRPRRARARARARRSAGARPTAIGAAGRGRRHGPNCGVPRRHPAQRRLGPRRWRPCPSCGSSCSWSGVGTAVGLLSFPFGRRY